jgi:hypothetical protein
MTETSDAGRQAGVLQHKAHDVVFERLVQHSVPRLSSERMYAIAVMAISLPRYAAD